MRVPRFVRRFAVRLDHGYEHVGARVGGGTVVVASGPYTDRYFWRRTSAERHVANLRSTGVPDDGVRLYRLGWSPEE